MLTDMKSAKCPESDANACIRMVLGMLVVERFSVTCAETAHIDFRTKSPYAYHPQTPSLSVLLHVELDRA
jgi:hypothetical protein